MQMSIQSGKVRKKIFTWHIHGSYLYYLVQTDHEFYLPVKPGGAPGYGGRAGTFPWPNNVHDVAVEDVPGIQFDAILFQSHQNYLQDQYEVLSAEQRNLPSIYLEHDPPRENPTDTRHPVDDPNVLLVHVTHFNDLMWDSGRTPTTVIEHGVMVPDDACYSGELERGIVVVNNLGRRGRRLGTDVYQRACQEIPLDLVGMNAIEMGGLGEIDPMKLANFEARYRFFFNPIRYTSLGLAVCEALMIGMPVVGLATTEMSTTIQNGVNGFIDTDVSRLIDAMRFLLNEPGEARKMGEKAREYALDRFNIQRFSQDWDRVIRQVTAG
jgi:glycosyltransferase involved in cell wall biosynthesis